MPDRLRSGFAAGDWCQCALALPAGRVHDAAMAIRIRQYIPRVLKEPIREGLNWLHTYRYMKANPDTIVPPASMSFVGGGDCLEIGLEFLEHFKNLGSLEPHHQVLDVGCGYGRMAIPLTGYLSEKGSYRGFDIVPVGVNWCRDRITPRFPNFRFELADIRNTHYNPRGRLAASEYVFPYPDSQFDFVFLTSVFTHLLPAAQIRYLSEIRRVLKNGGRALMTFLLLDREAERGIAAGRSALQLKFTGTYEGASYRFESRNNPEETVAYPEEVVLSRIEQSGLGLVHPVQHGHWSGREGGRSFQDIIVVGKSV